MDWPVRPVSAGISSWRESGGTMGRLFHGMCPVRPAPDRAFFMEGDGRNHGQDLLLEVSRAASHVPPSVLDDVPPPQP
ncbi:MAG: hypothetical protein LBT40_11845 [Deltaproteobacteria bacterium]|nr:hypothetical protein [Deltaproteobacteria bacterium]